MAAQESCGARLVGRVTAAALRVRGPARRCAGSVRNALVISATVMGGYTLLIGSVFAWGGFWMPGALMATNSGFCYITSIMNIFIVFGIFAREDKILKNVLCANMAIYMVCIPLILSTIIVAMITGYIDVFLWELPHIVLSVLHLALMYIIMLEVRGDAPTPLTPPPPPADGWLKNNLAQAGPPRPTLDAELAKVKVDGGAAPPAVITPSSCTTLQQPRNATSATCASGPTSTSDA